LPRKKKTRSLPTEGVMGLQAFKSEKEHYCPQVPPIQSCRDKGRLMSNIEVKKVKALNEEHRRKEQATGGSGTWGGVIQKERNLIRGPFF